jgi:EpsI family protein
LILLLVFLGLTAVPVLYRPQAAVNAHAPSLAAALSHLPGWRMVRQFPLDPRVIEELKPDDYAFLSYSNGGTVVSLYVGYYTSSAKVGAPHHPLVCFSGQGWELSPISKERLTLADGHILSFASMTAGLDLENIYLTYWFQAHDEAVDSPLLQKITLARKRLFDRQEDNAFVRVSLPMGDKSPAECRRLVEDFLQAFYPVFLTYIRERA